MQPIGVFDSGVGGLSVLQALRLEMPHERFVYVSDAGHAPYGERDVGHVVQRSMVVGDYLVQHHHARALVVACNTATAAAIVSLRAAYAALPIVGVEPALKPAAAVTRTARVGVLATRGTLGSDKFQALLQAQNPAVHFVLQACDGLAAAIERDDAAEIQSLCARYTANMGRFGVAPGDIDTVVLGCTHYAFAATELQNMLGPSVALLDAGHPVAQRTSSLLALQYPKNLASDVGEESPGWVELWTTGVTDPLQHAAQRWLSGTGQVRHVRQKPKSYPNLL
jgi:glutamate racemase